MYCQCKKIYTQIFNHSLSWYYFVIIFPKRNILFINCYRLIVIDVIDKRNVSTKYNFNILLLSEILC